MSKIGKLPISLGAVSVNIAGHVLTIKGPKGELSHNLPSGITVEQDGDILHVKRESDSKSSRALHGLTRAILANHVEGVTSGFKKSLELVGTGYRAKLAGSKLVLSLGLSHEIEFTPSSDVQIQVEGTNLIHISGVSKHLVGQVAANIRAYKPPEPYKGKGIKYQGEIVRRKAGKAAKSASA